MALHKELNFILIGGWAVYLYTQSLKSKDIDIIIDYEQLTALQKNYQLSKNERLKKYEIHKAEIDVDIYVPLYSEIGIPITEIQHYAIPHEGFKVPSMTMLILLKLFAYKQRQHSIKGEKDAIDILSLLKVDPMCIAELRASAARYQLEYLFDELKMILTSMLIIMHSLKRKLYNN